MKKTYIIPVTEMIAVNVVTHLMENSILGTNMKTAGFTEDIKVGGTTTEADSRRNDFWDDED